MGGKLEPRMDRHGRTKVRKKRGSDVPDHPCLPILYLFAAKFRLSLALTASASHFIPSPLMQAARSVHTKPAGDSRNRALVRFTGPREARNTAEFRFEPTEN